jgi:ribonuclease P protein component
MLPIANRLLKEYIRTVFSAGKRIATPELLMYYTDSQTETSQFAIVVGKRISTLASKRNRIKRLVRQSIIKTLPFLVKPIAGIIVVQKIPSELTQKSVDILIKQLFQKIGRTSQ